MPPVLGVDEETLARISDHDPSEGIGGPTICRRMLGMVAPAYRGRLLRFYRAKNCRRDAGATNPPSLRKIRMKSEFILIAVVRNRA